MRLIYFDFCLFQPKIDQLQEDVKLVRPAVEQTRQGQTKNPDVDRLEEDVNRYRLFLSIIDVYQTTNDSKKTICCHLKNKHIKVKPR